MEKVFSVSVAMAVYNGEKFIREQIDSILKQLNVDDELVISYNESTDNSLEIIEKYQLSDNRVRVIKCEKKGVIYNFENALLHCKNDIIFLADQDDVWNDEKIKIVLSYFIEDKVSAVIHNKTYVNNNLKVIKEYSTKEIKDFRYVNKKSIIYKNLVQGSCLAFRKRILKKVLPFPKKIPMHDSWIGMIACDFGKVIYINKKLLLYRIHENNLAPKKHKRVIDMIKDRICLLYNYLKRRKQGEYDDKDIVR